ncbi:MAG: ABC transporter substrate-binding protein [Deltaproteobacteria bacterium]|nr:ABC transporter substrate-binding protein [Deltaproteobacteria bacterium]MBI2181859.1 ABC transporter substrate-binding protein [Deltaproteobacteria bacterium]
MKKDLGLRFLDSQAANLKSKTCTEIRRSIQNRKLVGIVALAITIAMGGVVGEAADKVRMSISSIDVSFLTAGLALKRGMFRDEGFDLELIRMNANVSVTALSTGDIDFTMVFASVVRGALRGMPMKVVASFMDSSTHLLIARPEYKSIRDLKGRTLAVSTFGATSDVAARMMMKQGGVDPEKELKIIPLGVERARYAALREGIVDVAVLSPPTDTDAQRHGYRILSRFHEHFKLPFTGLGTHLKKLKEKPDEVKRMVRALLRANRFVRANREGTIQTMMDWNKVDRESAVATYDSTWKIFSEDGGISESGLKLVIDQGREAMKIERPVANAEVADFSIIREVQKELGIKK